MKKNKILSVILIFFGLFLYSCQTATEALQGKKRSDQSDEFLVKKKNPLQMPPDINKLPLPGDDLQISIQTDDDQVKDLLKIKKDNNTENPSAGSDLLNNMKKKIQ